MLCSICNKNTAVVFINKQGEDGKTKVEGYCYDCAKKHGINPMDTLMKQANLTEKDLNDMTKQIESMVTDMAQNMDMDALSEQMNNMDQEELDKIEEQCGMPIQFGAIPLGSIFSNMFGANSENGNADSEANASSEKKKVKIDKDKKKDKKRKTLEMYGTNLTQKAKNNQLDMVIGRDKEIQRMIQILNRRSKNNPCLIGEPGVGKTAIAQGLAIKIANGRIPAKLLNKEVYLLDMTAIIAGTQFRGQFEARMKSIIDECKNAGNIKAIEKEGEDND